MTVFSKILVTLDGSKLAETVLPWVPSLASAVGATQVVLLSVIEEGAPEQLHMAEGYLREQGAQLRKTWWQGKGQVPPMDYMAVRARIAGVADAILHFAEDNNIDLIMLCTHGRSGIQRWSLGSVAERVATAADIPVFLVRAIDEPVSAPTNLRRFLVPLDGSELAEHALPQVEQLYGAAGREAILLYVEDPTAVGSRVGGIPLSGPGVGRREGIRTYLDSIASGLAMGGTKVEVKIRPGHPAQEIVRETEDGLVDLIVMSSHGRTGLARWAFGSVTDQVLHSSLVPILLVPSQVKGTVPPHLQGPLVYRCHHCGRRTYRDPITSQHQCARCGYFLKACGNCIHYEGTGCILQLPYVAGAYPGNRCPEFEFRKTRIVLR
jgi:nucleotide-binding universal stress UspA family protein